MKRLLCVVLGHVWSPWRPAFWVHHSTNGLNRPVVTSSSEQTRVCVRGDHLEFRYGVFA